MADRQPTRAPAETLDDQVRPGGINQGQGSDAVAPSDDPEEAAKRRYRRSIGDLVDDNVAAHMGGAGAQGGQADYGSAGNLAGMDKPDR